MIYCFDWHRMFNCWLVMTLNVVLLVWIEASGQTVTIDADGPANFSSLDTVLYSIQNGSGFDPETLLFVGDNQHIYTWSRYCDKKLGEIWFIGSEKDPAKFPIINNTSSSTYNFFNDNTVHFERVIITGTYTYDLGIGTQTHTFKQCIIRKVSSNYVFSIAGSAPGAKIFENCLITGNKTVFKLNYYGGMPVLSFVNCTFDSNSVISEITQFTSSFANVTIKNCIFSNNATIFPVTAVGDSLRAKTTYSLTSEDVTKYGTGCIRASDPLYGKSSSRSAPVDWRPQPASPARNIGTSTGAPTVDISDTIRIQDSTGRRDAGCWDIRDTIQPPGITKDLPSDTSIGIGKSIVFRITATGTEPLTYIWRKVGSSTILSSVDSLRIDTVKASDDSARYYCVVRNARDSAVSNTVRLHAVAPPVITEQPRELIQAYPGDTVVFSVKADGEGVSYVWKRNGNVISGATLVTYTLPVTSYADSGIFVCVVTNIAGTDSTKPIRLQVLPPAPKIIYRTSDTTLPQGGSVRLSVTVQGKAPLIYLWKKEGDTAVLSSADTLLLTSLKTTAGTVYRCIVSNGFGKDSVDIKVIVVTVTVYNPLSLKAIFVDPTRLLLTIGNYLALPSSESAGSFSDTVGVWYSTLTFPAPLVRTAINLIKIPLYQLKADGDDSYDTVIQYTSSPPDSCKSLYVAVSPFWKNPDTIPPAGSGQSVKVFMCSIDTLANKLTLDISYTRVSDSATFTIGNLSSINRDSLMYIILQYGMGKDVFSADSTIKIYPPELPPVPADKMSNTIRDPRFGGIEDTLTVRVFWRGILGNTSTPPAEKKIVIGKLRPANSAKLFVDSTTTDAIYFHWQFSGTTDFDSVRILWGREKIPLAADFDTVKFSSMIVKKNTTDTVIKGLLSNTCYWIGLQVAKESVWSVVTENSRDSAVTKSLYQASVPNRIRLLSSFFDTATNLIMLSWNIDTNGIGPVDELETGIVWAIEKPPADIVPKEGVGRIVSNLKVKDNSAGIDLGEELVFSTTYHFALLLRRKKDIGWAEATDSSRGIVNVPAESWQKVAYFIGKDTVTAFNGKVVLCKAGESNVSVIDTIRVFKPSSPPRGFIIVGLTGIDFVNDFSSDPINIGLRYIDKLPAGFYPSDIKMYQYNTRTGWNVIDDCKIDTTARIVSTIKRISEYSDPFILMIDTLRPIVSILSDTASPVLPFTNIVDTVNIDDNVSNSRVKVFYWRSDKEEYASEISYSCKAENYTLSVTVPASLVSDDYGVRPLLVVSDGRFRVTTDISRRVIRSMSSKSDDIVLRERKWTPLSTTTLLNEPSIEKVLDELATDGKWEYDSMRMRIFRWTDTASVRTSALTAGDTHWVEYRHDHRNLFELAPGRVIWVKTWKDISVKQGEGTTVSMRAPYKIILKSNNWTDIALPYKFNIRIGDILCETSPDTAVTDNIHIYKWEISGISGNIVSRQKHIPGIPFLDSSASSLASGIGADGVGTYTIFNASMKDIELKIPPLPEMYSSFTLIQGAARKRKEQSEWSIIVEASTDKGGITPVFCGFRPGKGVSFFPVAPSFSKQKVVVIDTLRNRAYGNMIYHEADKGGFIFPLQFVNEESEAAVFLYNITVPPNLPASYRIGIYDPITGSVDYNTNEKSVRVGGKSKSYRWLLVGDSSYMAAWSVRVKSELALLKVIPATCRGMMHIEFNLPYSDIEGVKIEIINQLGRLMSKKSFSRESLRPGLNKIDLAQRGLSPGTYIIRLEALNSKARPAGTRHRKILIISP